MNFNSSFDRDYSFWFPNNIDYHIIPKNACSTVRHFLRQTITKTPDLPDYPDDSYSYISIKEGMLLKEYYKSKRSSAVTFTIKRDPVERFISAYTDIVMYRGKKKGSVQDFLEGKLKDIHFQSQTYFAGKVNDIDYVFDITELDKVAEFISDMTKTSIRNQHIRKIPVEKIKLTRDEEINILDHYKEDYINGWY